LAIHLFGTSDKQESALPVIKRESIFKEEILLIFLLILLIIEFDSYISQLHLFDPNNTLPLLSIQSSYVIIFFALVISFFPKKTNRFQFGIIGLTIIILRIKAIIILPVISTDLHRNLLFGSVLANGWNPYLWTIQDLPALLGQNLFASKVSYISEYASHSYDYPSMAIIFFALIAWISPADNYSAFIIAKLVFILFDLANSALIYKIMKSKLSMDGLLAKKISILYLLNPFSIFWVALEGQFEVIPIFFLLLAIYFVLSINQNDSDSTFLKDMSPYFAGIAIGMGFLFKYFPIIFIPAIIYYFKTSLGANIRFLISVVATISFLSFPFIISSYYITNFLEFQISRDHNFLNDRVFPIFGIFEVTLFPIVVLLVIIALVIAHKTQEREQKMFILGTLTMIIFLFINFSIFSWYVMWLFPFGIFISSKQDELLHSILFWGINITIFIVLWTPQLFYLLIIMSLASFFLTWQQLRQQVRHQVIKIKYIFKHNKVHSTDVIN